MMKLRRNAHVITSLLLILSLRSHQVHGHNVDCPTGFKVAESLDELDRYCYKLKDPEPFKDQFVKCTNNQYTSRLYRDLDILDAKLVLWTEYKSAYPGGPFVDWSYTDSIGKPLNESVNVNYDPSLGIDEELCLVFDRNTNYTAVRCKDNHYRYCVIDTYETYEDNNALNEGCNGLNESKRLWSPVPTCLTEVTAAGGGAVRATWTQAQSLCERKGGVIMNKGWLYSNKISRQDTVVPFGVTFSRDSNVMNYTGNIIMDQAEMPPRQDKLNFTPIDTLSYGAIENGSWYPVSNAYVFLDVICETLIQMKNISFNVTISNDNKISLIVSDPMIKSSDIRCFTDSVKYTPISAKIKPTSTHDFYIISPHQDGYYWCTHTNTLTYEVSESNRALFVREKESLRNVYSVKLMLINGTLNVQELEKKIKHWVKQLKAYIYYSTIYLQTHGLEHDLNASYNERVLKNFKSDDSKLKLKDILCTAKLKQLYLDRKTVLLHVEVSSTMQAVLPGVWEDLKVLHMKSVYYCKEKPRDGFTELPVGESMHSLTNVCTIGTCVGDFNDGVQWVITADANCTKPPIVPTDGIVVSQPTELPQPTTKRPKPDSSEETDSISVSPPQFITTEEVVTAEATTVIPTTTTGQPTTTEIPTTTTLKPQQQLNNVLGALEALVTNESAVFMIDDLNDAIVQMDELFAEEEELNIPSNLLQLLDEACRQVYLNGSDVIRVQNNVAILVADSNSENPVSGMRIAALNTSVFDNNAFEITRGESINDTELQSNSSTVVVNLPRYAMNSSRISFVAFRNDRAFQSNYYSVNSLVLSIKIENVTQFPDGQTIDIYLNRNRDPQRNQSRVCAFWQFGDNQTGYWSQEGCTLIQTIEEGGLDMCRCTHLTHFAEILVSRTVFSEENETALEIISVIGSVFSIFGLLVIAFTAVLFRSWRRDYNNKIWLQLCVSVLVLVMLFLASLYLRFESATVGCVVTGAALHYTTLASFCWMLVAAVLSYRRLVMVFTRDASHKLLRASAFAWGVPCVVVGILLSVDPRAYSGQFGELSPAGTFCYPGGLALWLSVYAPIALMLVANWTLFFLIVRSVFASRRIHRHGETNEALRCASVSCVLVFLFGLPWLFGLFSFYVVPAYFFAMLTSFQGFFLFLFFVVGNKKTRDLWLNKLKIKQTRKVPVTSSTYTNRSTGAAVVNNNTTEWRGGPSASIEAKVSKPKSLASPDDSRFS